MKIVAYLVIALLVVSLAGGAYFYLQVYQPEHNELAKFKEGQPEYDLAKKALKKYQDREKQETGWIGPVAESLKKGLAGDIAAGRAEVAVAGKDLVVNIAEGALFTPQSVTFADPKVSKPALDNLAALLKDLRGKTIVIGNSTQPAPAQGRGRKKVPARDARSLASGRSMELVKALVKAGVQPDSLVAAAYDAKLPDQGFKIKGGKTMIIISVPAAAEGAAAAPSQPAAASGATATPQQTKPAASTAAAVTSPSASPAAAAASKPAGPQPIPISPNPPKKTP